MSSASALLDFVDGVLEYGSDTMIYVLLSIRVRWIVASESPIHNGPIARWFFEDVQDRLESDQVL